MKREKNKESSFELLKIIAMLMIVSHHVVSLNSFNIDTQITGLSFNKVVMQFLGNQAFIGNNLFFMISAWFLCAKNEGFSKDWLIKRWWRIEEPMLFYSIGIVIFLCGWNSVSVKDFFPLVTERWWYPTSYFLFLCFYPFYQRALSLMSPKSIVHLIIIMFSLWCLPTLIPVRLSLGAGCTTTFFLLYAVVYYLRYHGEGIIKNYKLQNWVAIGGYVLALLSIITLDLLGLKVDALREYSCYYIRGNWRVLPFFISISIFLIFVTRIKFSSKFINAIGLCTFGVYLIHMHPSIQKLLFQEVLDMTSWIGSNYAVFYYILSFVALFIVCITIEFIRIRAFSFIVYITRSLFVRSHV